MAAGRPENPLNNQHQERQRITISEQQQAIHLCTEQIDQYKFNIQSSEKRIEHLEKLLLEQSPNVIPQEKGNGNNLDERVELELADTKMQMDHYDRQILEHGASQSQKSTISSTTTPTTTTTSSGSIMRLDEDARVLEGLMKLNKS